ncbi:MAG TPA: DUF5658 family protein [Candidatus Dojkabacteria bacterium]|nr:DUF5658 family protein [Candidatus Dojkabacteria bacterium]
MNLFFATIFIILNILDIITTKKIISLGGYEVNLIPRMLLKIKLFTPVKLAVTIALSIFIMINEDVYIGIIFCGIMSLFVINNYYQLYMYNKELQL